MSKRKLMTESEVKGIICTCAVCGNKFINTTGAKNPMCPKCIEETVARHKNEMAEKCVTSPNSILGNKPNTPFSCPVRVPEKGTPDNNAYTLSCLEAQLYAQSLENPYGDLPPTQQKIHQIMNAMKDLLLYKNQKYGDSAINPKGIFYKGDSTNSILIRLDDKIGRVMSNTEEKPRVNDVCDIIGYCTLLLISMGVTAEDIAKFKD